MRVVFFVGEGGRPPNPRRGTNRKGRSCAGGDGVGAVGAAGVREREGGDGIGRLGKLIY